MANNPQKAGDATDEVIAAIQEVIGQNEFRPASPARTTGQRHAIDHPAPGRRARAAA